MPSLGEIKEQIKDRIDLSQVVSKHAKLIKTASGYKACCPLPGHIEKTPSFNIDTRKNLYYCYGCQRGGDVFKFLEEVEGLSFMEALKELAEQLNIEVPKANSKDMARAKEERSKRDEGFEALARTSAFFHYLLMNSKDEGALEAKKYLLEKRKLSLEEIKALQLGWAAARPDLLANKLKEAGLLKVAEEAGLVRNYGGKFYDFFQDRLMIPIRDRRGRVIAFSGRTLREVDAQNPKYKNSPETMFFKKKEVLYGLDKAIPLINEKKFVCLVEGYFDQWAFQRAGIPAVAVMGTALSPEHLRELERFTRHMILVLDSDKAGIASTKRSLPLLLKNGWDVKVFSGLEGKDPDEWLLAKRLSDEEVARRLKDAPEALEWLLLQTLQEAKQERWGRAATLSRIRELWSQGVDSAHKEILLNLIATYMGLRVEELKKAFDEMGKGLSRGAAPREASKGAAESGETSLRYEPFKDHSRSKNSWDRDAEELLVWWIRHWDLLHPANEVEWAERCALFEGSLAENLVKSWAQIFAEGGAKRLPLKVVEEALEQETLEAVGAEPLLRQWLFRGLVAPEGSEGSENVDKVLISFRELAYSLKKEKTHAEIARLEHRLRSSSSDESSLEILQKIQMLRISLENKS